MPRRAGDARSGGTPRLYWRSPADKRTPRSVAKGTDVFSEAAVRAGEAMRLAAVRAAWDAAPRPRMELAPARSEHLAIDYHRQKKEREVKQRKLVHPPGRLRPVFAPAHSNDSYQQNATKNDSRGEIHDAEGAEREWKQREGDENDVVRHHLPHRLPLSPHERRHRNSCPAVVLLLE